MNQYSQAVVNSLSMPSSSAPRESGDGVSDQFPAGLRVLVVDDDQTCLKILDRMLRKCCYEVTKCNRAEIALSWLRENRNGFDIVISDVHMPDMDGFKLLVCIGLEMNLPVIMMSADDSKIVVMKGVTHGACDYLIKPVRIEALRNIWQHVVRKEKHKWKDFEQSGILEDDEKNAKPCEDADYSSANEANWTNSKRRKDEEDEFEEREDTSTLKKPRVVWSVELHQQFVLAVNQLGIDKAFPKKILDLMNVPGLTRENVASHLQKFRLYLRRLSGVSHHPNGFNNSFMGGLPEATFGSISSLNGLDLQTLAAAGQLPKSGIASPLVDQRTLYGLGTPKIRLGEGQRQQHSIPKKQINLFHGVPTTLEPKHLANFQQSVHNTRGSQSSSLLVQMVQQQSSSPIMNETNGVPISRISSSVGHPIPRNGVSAARNGIADSVYNPVSQPAPMLGFPVTQNADLPGNSFSLGNDSGMFNLTSKGMPYGEVNSRINGSRGFAQSYNNFSELHPLKSQEWQLQNVGLPTGASPLFLQRGSSSGQINGPNSNASVEREVFSAGEQQFNALLSDNSFRVKTEILNDSDFENTLFLEPFDQEDLLSALQQEGIGAVENEFGFEGFPLDNLSV